MSAVVGDIGNPEGLDDLPDLLALAEQHVGVAELPDDLSWLEPLLGACPASFWKGDLRDAAKKLGGEATPATVTGTIGHSGERAEILSCGNYLEGLVREGGIEPPRAEAHKILSPFPPKVENTEQTGT